MEKDLKKICIAYDIYNWITLLYTWNTVNQVYFTFFKLEKP